MVIVALDAMGGDHGPAAAVEGALLSAERGYTTADQIVLVGRREPLVAELESRGFKADHFQIREAEDELDGTESPVEAMRRKPNNPAAVGIGLVKSREVDAFVSAGNTGLVVAAATLALKCLEGIRRPGIAVTIQGERGPFMVVDVGANPQPKPIHLLHYALMGSAYFNDTFGTERPKIGLLNIGSEDRKGNAMVREASQLLKQRQANFEFVGNVEGIDVFSGACDVVICDGFTGNVLLKVSEGVAEFMLRSMAHFMAEEGVNEERRKTVLSKMQRYVDYSEYGGALLLGVEGIVTICHGRSKGPAIGSAIRFATKAVGARVNEHIIAAARSVSAAT